ncbi:hypothetical protein [Moorena sp. SIOASIH]|nr:hypothetical protein [Moorena sp. SIOASIH]
MGRVGSVGRVGRWGDGEMARWGRFLLRVIRPRLLPFACPPY